MEFATNAKHFKSSLSACAIVVVYFTLNRKVETSDVSDVMTVKISSNF